MIKDTLCFAVGWVTCKWALSHIHV